MCCKFIRFFGDIHGGHTNRVMTDFGLTNGYHVSRWLGPREESQTGLSSFFAAGTFVDDTIWVGSSQAATQLILNVASEFFCINNISINNDKTVVILINICASVSSLFISGSPISIAKSDKSHHYLGIFLLSEGLSKPSLAKVHSDVCFFTNLVLRKAVLDKQFLYLVSAVLHSIISYRTQFSFVPVSVCNKWDALIYKGLKFKSGLPLNFPSDMIHHLSFYGLKSFAQIQLESKVASLICFVNSIEILGCLFSHRSHDLQVLCWRPVHPLSIPVCVQVSPLNNFLAGVVRIFLDCNLSLSGFFDSPFWLRGEMPMFAILILPGNISVYMDGSLMNFSTENCAAGAGVFFSDINLGLGVGVLSLLSSTLAEIQAIVLALECIPHSSSVHLFFNSQAVLNACKSELDLVCPDFCNHCWVKHQLVVNIIYSKNLRVEWHKVKDHSGMVGNEYADVIAGASSHSGWFFSLQLNVHFLLVDGGVVSGNSRHFVHDIFCSVCRVHWKIGSDSKFLPTSLLADID
ncbi:hypothetical protein G9A89_013670 [Geosiphon pyriformis]|nr:hypothetical protein G9A89_013670 [Geosiphon pyriformis]